MNFVSPSVQKSAHTVTTTVAYAASKALKRFRVTLSIRCESYIRCYSGLYSLWTSLILFRSCTEASVGGVVVVSAVEQDYEW